MVSTCAIVLFPDVNRNSRGYKRKVYCDSKSNSTKSKSQSLACITTFTFAHISSFEFLQGFCKRTWNPKILRFLQGWFCQMPISCFSRLGTNQRINSSLCVSPIDQCYVKMPLYESIMCWKSESLIWERCTNMFKGITRRFGSWRSLYSASNCYPYRGRDYLATYSYWCEH